MNLQYEVLAVGFKEPGPKGAPLVVLYVGEDVEVARDVLEQALDAATIVYGRVYRGQGLAGQLIFAAGPKTRPVSV